MFSTIEELKFVIEPQIADGKTNLVVQQKFIRTGRAHGDFISVESGLKAGDETLSGLAALAGKLVSASPGLAAAGAGDGGGAP